MTHTKFVYTLRISGLLLSWHFLYWGVFFQMGGRIAFGYNQITYHESENCTISSFFD